MKVTKTSPVTGKKNTKDLEITPEQLERWRQGELIQSAMPNLSVSEREFLMTGMCDDDWDRTFKE